MRVIASVITGLTIAAGAARADGDITQVLTTRPAPVPTVIPGTETDDLPPLLAVPGEPTVRTTNRKSCRTCASDYNPNYAYLPDQNPDCRGGRCSGGAGRPADMFRVNVEAFIGHASDIRDVDHDLFCGVKVGVLAWLDSDHSLGLDGGFLNAHDPFRDIIQGLAGPTLIDSPATLTTADLNLRTELFTRDRVRVDVLAGYRFLSVHEQLLEGSVAGGVNFYEVWNTVNLGQVGAAASWHFGPYSAEALLKLGFGSNNQTAETNGVRTTDSEFAFVPEFGVRAGHGTNRFRVTAGYSLIYLSQAVRPNNREPGDYFLQGVTLGAEVRY